MHLSLAQQCFSCTLLLLLMSMVSWENMASSVKVTMFNVSCHSPFGNMLDQAIKSSQEMNHRISALSTHFNKFYINGWGFKKRTVRCHTSALSRPANKKQALSTKPEVLLKLAHSLLQAWVNTLHHLWVEMGDKLGYTPYHLTKALEIKIINRNLLKTIKTMSRTANLVIEENVNTPAWSELASLQATNRDTRYFAFYNLFHCLGSDSSDIEMYLKILKHQMVQTNC